MCITFYTSSTPTSKQLGREKRFQDKLQSIPAFIAAEAHLKRLSKFNLKDALSNPQEQQCYQLKHEESEPLIAVAAELANTFTFLTLNHQTAERIGGMTIPRVREEITPTHATFQLQNHLVDKPLLNCSVNVFKKRAKELAKLRSNTQNAMYKLLDSNLVRAIRKLTFDTGLLSKLPVKQIAFSSLTQEGNVKVFYLKYNDSDQTNDLETKNVATHEAASVLLMPPNHTPLTLTLTDRSNCQNTSEDSVTGPALIKVPYGYDLTIDSKAFENKGFNVPYLAVIQKTHSS